MGSDVRQQRAQSGPLYLDIVSREHEPQFIVAAFGLMYIHAVHVNNFPIRNPQPLPPTVGSQ